MKSETIQIKGVEVEIQFVEDHGDKHCGWAYHTVASSDLDDGTADGPNDGETFILRGETYRLGQHDYETDEGQTTCTARIYLESSES
jgi:hypothetical protein